ncbi:MAG: NfeD family protein [Planctomycetota bacterium]
MKPRIESARHWLKAAARLAFLVLLLALVGYALGVHPVMPIAAVLLLPLVTMGILSLPFMLLFQWIIVPPGGNLAESSGYSEYKRKKKLAPRLIGEIGIAQTDLRPMGSVHVKDEFWIARVDGGHISARRPVRVIGAESMFLVVEQVDTRPDS